MTKLTQKQSKFAQFLKVEPKPSSLPNSQELIKTNFLRLEQTWPSIQVINKIIYS